MKKYNVIVVFSKDFTKTLMCKRTKEPPNLTVVNKKMLFKPCVALFFYHFTTCVLFVLVINLLYMEVYKYGKN